MSIKYTRKDIDEILVQLEVGSDQGIFIHSSIPQLGFAEKSQECIEWWVNSLVSRFGDSCTIGVPTFNFDFCKGKPFSRESTKSQLGILSESLRLHRDSLRTAHAINSCSFIGNRSKTFSKVDTQDVYAQDGIFAKMLEEDFQILLLGTSFQSISFVHLAESRVNVPYRYYKDFTGFCKDYDHDSGTKKTYQMFVRDLNLNPILKLSKVYDYINETSPEKLKKYRSDCIKNLSLVSSRVFVNACLDILQGDVYGLLK